MQAISPDTFFTDTPLQADDLYAQWHARWERASRWPGHTITEVNGHLIWRRPEDLREGDCRVFYDGDYSDVLAPDDPRILIPREECTDLPPEPIRLEWDE